jgi:hypothetical protein
MSNDVGGGQVPPNAPPQELMNTSKSFGSAPPSITDVAADIETGPAIDRSGRWWRVDRCLTRQICRRRDLGESYRRRGSRHCDQQRTHETLLQIDSLQGTPTLIPRTWGLKDLRSNNGSVSRWACSGLRRTKARDGEIEGWWSQAGSNRRPPACHAGALPAELWPLQGTVISSQLIRKPKCGPITGN